MAEQKIKFKVSIKELSFEFEGTRDMGTALQAGLSRSIGGLLDTQRTVMALPGMADAPADTTEEEVIPADPPNGHQTPPPEKVRKPRKSNGVSLTNLLRDLKKEGFFTDPRTADAIQSKLKEKGHSFTTNNIAARLQDVTKNGELFRKPSEGGYVYKDTPFDESPRTPNPPADASE